MKKRPVKTDNKCTVKVKRTKNGKELSISENCSKEQVQILMQQNNMSE